MQDHYRLQAQKSLHQPAITPPFAKNPKTAQNIMSSNYRNSDNEKVVISVSQLNQSARDALERALPSVWVEGEISNLVRPSSGHLYFSLKDDKAQVRAAMFKGQNRYLNFNPEDGQLVQVRGKISLYAPRGDYQLIADKMEQAGEGALRRAYEELKLRLNQQGLFDPEQKKPLPTFAQHIGVITSPTGAAIRDILAVLKRRFPNLGITLFPVSVQGDSAGDEIVNAIAKANRISGKLAAPLQALIVGRGGGSLEDLWAFNLEKVARAIYDSEIPIISAVGHEIDFTIADFVADVRAPTPSAAAELISPNGDELLENVLGWQQFFINAIGQKLNQSQQQLDWLRKQVRHPGQRLQDYQQRLDDIEGRLRIAINTDLEIRRANLNTSQENLLRYTPLHKIKQLQILRQSFGRRLHVTKQSLLHNKQNKLKQLILRLDTINPLATLARGYAIVSDDKNNILRDYQQVDKGQIIHTQLHQGYLVSEVKKKQKTKP